MHISVIGLGETGSAISLLLLGEFEGIHLNIMDPKTSISGRVLDFKHAGAVRDNRVSWNEQHLLEEARFIFFCAGSIGEKK